MSIIADMREWRARNPEADPITVGGEELDALLTADWRVLGGVIPGPIPVEWVRVGDTIRDHGFEGTVTAISAAAGRFVILESGHVSLVKLTRRDFIAVLSATNHANGDASEPDDCGARHPLRPQSVVCTLEAGHKGDHVDAENYLAGQWGQDHQNGSTT